MLLSLSMVIQVVQIVYVSVEMLCPNQGGELASESAHGQRVSRALVPSVPKLLGALVLLVVWNSTDAKRTCGRDVG